MGFVSNDNTNKDRELSSLSYDGIKSAEDYHIPQPYIDSDHHKTFERPNLSENLPKVTHS